MSGVSSGSPAKGDDGSYASKTDLIDWVNNLLQLQLTKLEQVRAAGARPGHGARRRGAHNGSAASAPRASGAPVNHGPAGSPQPQ